MNPSGILEDNDTEECIDIKIFFPTYMVDDDECDVFIESDLITMKVEILKDNSYLLRYYNTRDTFSPWYYIHFKQFNPCLYKGTYATLYPPSNGTIKILKDRCCEGCAEDQSNQLAHMGIYGCLHH